MSSTSQTETQQSSQTNPYAPAIPLLANEAATAGGISTGVTPAQQQALATLQGEAQDVPNLSPEASSAVRNNLTASTAPMQGMIGDAVNSYMANTNPIATGSTDPWQTPGFADALGHLNDTITHGVESTFAGSGRDPTGSGGAYSKAAVTALAPAEGQLLENQFNSNVQNKLAANQGQVGAATTGSTAMSGEELSALQEQLAGLQGGNSNLAGLLTLPGTTQYNAANTAYGTPWTNLSPALAASEGIGGMGGTGSGTGTTSQTTPALTNILGLLTGAAGVAGAVAKSDARLKENIKEVGRLHDGQKVHEFSWKGDPQKTRQIGLLAQEVEKVRPDAVHTLGGVKHVDYGKATENARRMGMLAA